MKISRKKLANLMLETTDLARHLTNAEKNLASLQDKLTNSDDKTIHILEINDVLRSIVEYLLAKSKIEKDDIS